MQNLCSTSNNETIHSYPFGMGMPTRSWSAAGENYRFGFNGKPKDDEVKGNENSYDFKFRIYDPRLGRFLSTDPLEKQFAWNSPYAYAMNRVIDGIDIEGKEYLRADQAKIGVYSGSVMLRVSNLSGASRGYINNRNINGPWNEGEMGYGGELYLPLEVHGNVSVPEGGQVIANDAFKDPTQITQPGWSHSDENPNLPPAQGGTKAHGALVAAVTIYNFGAVTWSNLRIGNDVTDVKSQLDNEFQNVLSDINDAINIGLIDKKYLNSNDIGTIANVVLTGENPSDNTDLYDIGMTIVKNISGNLRPTSFESVESQSGLDGFKGIEGIVPVYPEYNDRWNDDYDKKLTDVRGGEKQ